MPPDLNPTSTTNAGSGPDSPVAARRAEMRRLCDEIFEYLYSGWYYLNEGGCKAGSYFFCDGRAIVLIELCEGLVYRPVPFASEGEAIDAILVAMSDIRTRVPSPTPYTTCRDEDSAHTLINLQDVHARLTRWTFWRWFDGLHFHHVWPRRMRDRDDA